MHRTQIDQKSFCVGPEKHSATRTHLTSVLGHLGGVPGALLECSWAVLEHPGPSQERSWDVPGVSRTALGRLPRSPRSGPERPKAPDDGFYDFSSFWNRFSLIRARFSNDLGACDISTEVVRRVLRRSCCVAFQASPVRARRCAQTPTPKILVCSYSAAYKQVHLVYYIVLKLWA